MGNKRASILLFFAGMFSMTQVRVVGSIGISELVIFLVAPFVFLQDLNILRRDKFLTILNLALLTCCGCVLSSLYNHTPMPLFLRGFAAPYSIWACIVVFHRLLRRNLSGLKWALAGFSLSIIINIFCFQAAVEADSLAEGARGVDAAAGIMSGPIFWVGRLSSVLSLPYRGWFLSTPLIYTIVTPVFLVLFSMTTTTSGRSASLTTLAGLALILFCRKSQKRMRSFSKALPFFIVFGLVGVLLANAAYRYSAEKGWLGEEAYKKYVNQTKQGKDVLHLLMAGRSDFFVGLIALKDRPFWGYGPWARDQGGYMEAFLAEYGAPEDFEYYAAEMRRRLQTGQSHMLMPAHSHIVGFWLWFGALGMPIWFYVLCLIYDYYRHSMSAIPQYFGFLAMGLPNILWGIFFSPFSSRVNVAFLLTALLVNRAVAKRCIPLPPVMQMEIAKYNR